MLRHKANELGVALSETAEFKRLQDAKAAIEKDAEVRRLLHEYTQKQGEMVQIITGDGSTYGSAQDLSREIGEIQTELVYSPLFIEMVSAQLAFKNLMRQVNAMIEAHVGPMDAVADTFEVANFIQPVH